MAEDQFDLIQKSTELLAPSNSNGFPLPIAFDQTVDRSLSGSLWRNENMFGSFFENQRLNADLNKLAVDPNFDYFDNIPDDMSEFRDRFVGARSMEQMDAIAAQIRREQDDKANMANHPIKSLALGLIIGNADPSIIMPGGTFYKTAKAGTRAAKSALSVGAAAAAASSMQEMALIKTQQSRTVEEAGFNVLASALLGSVVGGVGGSVMGGAIGKKAKADISETYNHGLGPPREQDLSAAKVDPEYLRESDKLAGLGRFAGKLGEKLTAMNRLMNSDFQAARDFADLAYEHNIIKNKNLPESGNVAKPADVETKIKLEFGQVEKALADYSDIFYKQAGVDKGPFKSVRGVFAKQGLGYDDFDNAVGIALRNDGQHANPAVREGAELLRKKVFDPLKDEAIDMGLLPKNVNVKTALSYFTRVFDKQRIKENEGAFKDVIRPWITSKNEQLKAFMPVVEGMRKDISNARAALTRAHTNKGKLDALTAKKDLTKAEKRRLADLKKRLTPDEAEAILKNLEKKLEDDTPFDLKDSGGNLRKVLEDEGHIESVIDQITANILGRNEAKLLNPISSKFIGKGKTKPLHNRHFLIPDELIEGFTLNSASKVAELYSRGMIPTLQLNRFARRVDVPAKRTAKINSLLLKRDELEATIRNGTEGEKLAAQEEVAKINDDITELEGAPTPEQAVGQFRVDLEDQLSKEKAGKSPEEARKLEKMFDQNIQDINDTFELLQGIYGIGPNILDGTTAATVAKNVKQWNFIRLMGFMTISSLPDIGMHIMRHGPMAFMRDGLLPLVKHMEAQKLNREFLQDMGLSIETLRGQRLKSFLDHEGTALETGLFGKGLDFLTTTFGNATLMNQWQDMNHMIAGNMGISRTLRAIDKWARTGQMSRKDRIRFNSLSLTEDHWRTIHQQWKNTGGKTGEAYHSNWGDWNLEEKGVAEAYQAFREAIFKEVNQTVIMPGLGDKPLFAHTRSGSIMFQFKSFLFSATNKVLTAGLSRNDAEFYMGVVSMLTLGAMGYVITSLLRKPDEPVDLSWEKLTKEAIDRSGILGIFMEGFNMGEKLLGNNGVSRYQSRGVTGAFFGPSLGLAEDVAFLINKFSRSIADEDTDMTTKDAEKFMRLFPYQNMFYLYNLNRQVTKNIALGLNFEESP